MNFLNSTPYTNVVSNKAMRGTNLFHPVKGKTAGDFFMEASIELNWQDELR
jgi:hypothetical protein